MSDLESSNWSETAASNNASPPNGWPEGMLPSGTNDCGREMMRALKSDWNRVHGVISSTGSANAYVLTYTTAPAAYVNGQIFAFKTNFGNTGSATANVNSLGAKTINKQTSSGLAALSSGDMPSGIHVMLKYDSGADKLIWLNPTFGAAGATPAGSTYDVQYNAGGSTLGGATLAAGQPIIGVTSAAPAGGIVLGAYGGSMVLLEQHAASNSAQLDFTTFISATYDDYVLELVGMIVQTSTAYLNLRVGTGGGPTYDTGNNYNWVYSGANTAGTGATAGSSGSVSVISLGPSLGNASTSAYSGTFRLMNLQSTALNKQIFGTSQGVLSDGTFYTFLNGGTWLTSGTAVTAIRLLCSSGNIVSGTARIYGIAKA